MCIKFAVLVRPAYATISPLPIILRYHQWCDLRLCEINYWFYYKKCFTDVSAHRCRRSKLGRRRCPPFAPVFLQFFDTIGWVIWPV